MVGPELTPGPLDERELLGGAAHAEVARQLVDERLHLGADGRSVSVRPMTGPLPVTFVRIAQRAASSGLSKTWETPKGACSASITSSVSSPTEVFKNRYLISGKGSCTQPAVSTAEAGADGPVTIGAFSFAGFIDLRARVIGATLARTDRVSTLSVRSQSPTPGLSAWRRSRSGT